MVPPNSVINSSLRVNPILAISCCVWINSKTVYSILPATGQIFFKML